jgi:hypothetical protein
LRKGHTPRDISAPEKEEVMENKAYNEASYVALFISFIIMLKKGKMTLEWLC